MTGNLNGQIALVTGASRGIGAACARALAARGARVALAARSRPQLDELAREIGGGARAFEVDLSAPGEGPGLVEAVVREMGEIRLLVNNAGISLSKPIEKMSDADVDLVMGVNVRSVVALCAAAAPSMDRGGQGGSIVNVSSMSAATGVPYMSVYAGSKAALDGITRALACELGPRGIRVNSVLPGFILTDMWNRGREIPGLVDSVAERIALRRWGVPEDVADVVAFLSSDAARYVTGTALLVDGGFANMAEVLPRR